MKLLSIIIPVYNVEKYVGLTLNSIIEQQQNLFDYEVIVVDDGTPDNSMYVVEQYMDCLPMTIIHQENKGLSGARNTGLKHANGKYVWFIDSDDTIAEHIFEKLLFILNESECDVLGFCVNHVFEDGHSFVESPCCNRKRIQEIINKQMKGTELNKSMATGMAPRYIFRRDFLIVNDLWFKEGIIFEDVELIVKVKCLAKAVLLTNMVSYNYLRRTSGSIMSSQNMKAVYSLCSILNSWNEFRKSFRWNSRQNSIICSHAFERACQVLSMHKRVNDLEYSVFYKKNRWRYTLDGVCYYVQGFRDCPKKHILMLLKLILYPRSNNKK